MQTKMPGESRGPSPSHIRARSADIRKDPVRAASRREAKGRGGSASHAMSCWLSPMSRSRWLLRRRHAAISLRRRTLSLQRLTNSKTPRAASAAQCRPACSRKSPRNGSGRNMVCRLIGRPVLWLARGEMGRCPAQIPRRFLLDFCSEPVRPVCVTGFGRRDRLTGDDTRPARRTKVVALRVADADPC
jgi:hypothetical protein